MDILLSIGITTYNRATQARRQLLSILDQAQDFVGKDIEILISNNASTDDTDSTIRSIYVNRPVFTYFQQNPNIGMIGNIAFLSNEAHGKFLWILGDDDAIRPGTIRHILLVLSRWPQISALFLQPGGGKVSRITHKISWDKKHFLISAANLHKYNKDVLDIYPFPKSDITRVDWLFITGCIYTTKSFRNVANNVLYANSLAMPLIASCVTSKNNIFYVENTNCIIAGLEPCSWSYNSSIQLCNDLVSGIRSLNLYKFSHSEIYTLLINCERYIYLMLILDYITHDRLDSFTKNKILFYQNIIEVQRDNNYACNFISQYDVANNIILGTLCMHVIRHHLTLRSYINTRLKLIRNGLKVIHYRDFISVIKILYYEIKHTISHVENASIAE